MSGLGSLPRPSQEHPARSDPGSRLRSGDLEPSSLGKSRQVSARAPPYDLARLARPRRHTTHPPAPPTPPAGGARAPFRGARHSAPRQRLCVPPDGSRGCASREMARLPAFARAHRAPRIPDRSRLGQDILGLGPSLDSWGSRFPRPGERSPLPLADPGTEHVAPARGAVTPCALGPVLHTRRRSLRQQEPWLASGPCPPGGGAAAPPGASPASLLA